MHLMVYFFFTCLLSVKCHQHSASGCSLTFGKETNSQKLSRGPMLQDAASLLISCAVGLQRHWEAACSHASKEDALLGA